MTTSYLTDIISSIDNEYASLASDGIAVAIYLILLTLVAIFLMLLCLVVSLAVFLQTRLQHLGESSTGKTFFTISVMKHFLKHIQKKCFLF